MISISTNPIIKNPIVNTLKLFNVDNWISVVSDNFLRSWWGNIGFKFVEDYPINAIMMSYCTPCLRIPGITRLAKVYVAHRHVHLFSL